VPRMWAASAEPDERCRNIWQLRGITAALRDEQVRCGEKIRVRMRYKVLPKNVQAQTTKQYIFKAHVTSGGNVTTVPVSTPAEVRELERIESKEAKKGYFASEEDEAIRAELEAEFGGGGAVQTTEE
jgi:hypothetical protein